MKIVPSRSESLKKAWVTRRKLYPPTGYKDYEAWCRSIREGMLKPGAKTNDNEKAWITRRRLHGSFGMKKHTDREKYMEIEKKLKVTVFLPQTCHFCGKDITHKGNDKMGLVFHSLDGNHDNWDPANKVPAHHWCHTKYHAKYRNDKTKKTMGAGNTGPENNRKGWITRRKQHGPTGRR